MYSTLTDLSKDSRLSDLGLHVGAMVRYILVGCKATLFSFVE
jgi:hypothetical protein